MVCLLHTCHLEDYRTETYPERVDSQSKDAHMADRTVLLCVNQHGTGQSTSLNVLLTKCGLIYKHSQGRYKRTGHKQGFIARYLNVTFDLRSLSGLAEGPIELVYVMYLISVQEQTGASKL